MCVRASYMKLTRDTHLMQQFIYYYKQLYILRISDIYMPIFRNIRFYTYYTTPYGVQHYKRELCVIVLP